jgi:biopolymer transport protein ExbD
VKPIKPDAANLSVTTHGSVSWNDERMGDGQLAQRLQASAPRQPQPRTSSAATAWWAYQRVAQVLAAAQKSGC